MRWEEFYAGVGKHEEPPEELDVLARAVLGAAIEAHRILGPGHPEAAYQSAMEVELELRHIPYHRQVVYAVNYKGHHVCDGRMDLLVGGELIVELKACESLAAVHSAQLPSYLRATGKKLGLLINFNVPVLKDGIKRVIA